MNCVRESQSHALHNQAPQLETQLTPCDGIHSIRYSDITTCIDSVSARAAQLGDGWSSNELCEGEQSHGLHNQARQLKTQLTPCDGNTLTSGYSDNTTVYWFCECQSSTTGGRMVSKWMCEGDQSHAYIIKQPNLNTIDSLWWKYTDIRLQWHSYVGIDSVSARAGRTGDGWSPNECGGGERSHAVHNQAPNLNKLTPCDGIHWHQVPVTFTTCIDSVSARAAQLGDDGLQMNCVRESSLMLT